MLNTKKQQLPPVTKALADPPLVQTDANPAICNLHLLSFHAQHPSPLWGIKQDPYVASAEIWTELTKQPKALIKTGVEIELGVVNEKPFRKFIIGKLLAL